MNIPISAILSKLRPGEEYGRRGVVSDENSYNKNIEWRDVTTKPLFSDILIELPNSNLEISRTIKNTEIDEFVFDTIRDRLSINLSREQLGFILIIRDGLLLNNLSPAFKQAIDIIDFGVKKQRELNLERNKNTIENYNPRTDLLFPKFI